MINCYLNDSIINPGTIHHIDLNYILLVVLYTITFKDTLAILNSNNLQIAPATRKQEENSIYPNTELLLNVCKVQKQYW